MRSIVGNVISVFLTGEYDAFAHGCNCQCRFHRGVAKEVKARLPELHDVDQRTRRGHRGKLGGYSWHRYPEGLAFNAYTQFARKNPSDLLNLSALETAFTGIFRRMSVEGLASIVIPKIGSGLARGELTEEEAWSKVSEVIDRITPPSITVTVVELPCV